MLQYGLYNPNVTEVVPDLLMELLRWINPNNIPLTEEIESLIKKHRRFFRRFRLQSCWEEDRSLGTWLLKAKWRLLNRITHPVWRRKQLRAGLSNAVREWVKSNISDLGIDNDEFMIEAFVDLF